MQYINGNASGQIINFQKYALTFGDSIKPRMKEEIKVILGIHSEGGTCKYLGLPECFNGSKQKLFGFIGERLQKKRL